MSNLSSRSPFAELFQFEQAKIITKVRTVIQQERKKKVNAIKKKKAYDDAKLKMPPSKAQKKGKGRGKDNPKL